MEFLRGALKVSVAIVAAVIALTAIGLFGAWGYSSYEKAKARQYETVKPVAADFTDWLQMRLVGKTKLVDQRLYADLRFIGNPPYLTYPANLGPEAAFNIHFLDADGFKIFEKRIPLNEFTKVLEGGKQTGLSYEFDESMSTETYRRFDRISLTASVSREKPRSAFDQFDEPKVKALPDHCAANLSKEERLKRLAKHGSVRQTGLGEYSVGYRHIAFLSGNELLSCR